MTRSIRSIVCLSTLAPAIKRNLWDAIRREAPDLAELLTDPPLQELVRTFDAAVHVDLDDLPPAALQVLREANAHEDPSA